MLQKEPTQQRIGRQTRPPASLVSSLLWEQVERRGEGEPQYVGARKELETGLSGTEKEHHGC